MKFAIVQGTAVGEPHQAERVAVQVSLDCSGRLSMVRDGLCVLLASPQDVPALDWNADQYTQETIGTTLAEQGWEVVSSTPQAQPSAPGLGVSSIYFVRQP